MKSNICNLYVFLGLVLMIPLGLSAQNRVGIHTNTPDASAILHIDYSDKGLLIPRVSLNDVNDTSLDGTNTAATGLLIWNTNASVNGGDGTGFYFFNGSIWESFDNFKTLDEAYDNDGAGLGRNIVADNGAVSIQGQDGIVVTGTLGSGEIIDNTTSGTGVKMFFNPLKSSFRAGYVSSDLWDDYNFLNYTFAAGHNTRASSARSFSVNLETQVFANGRSGAAFGNATKVIERYGFASGNTTKVSERSGISLGEQNVSTARESSSFGNSNTTKSIREVTWGSYAKSYARNNDNISSGNGNPDDDSRRKFYQEDRILVLGNGTSDVSRSNLLEIWKDGKVIINDAYTLPLSDGANGRYLSTDGLGNISWKKVKMGHKQSLFTLYADSDITINSNSNRYYDGFDIALLPQMFDDNADGTVRVKMVIRYTSLTGTHKLRLRVDDGTGAVNVINPGAFTDTPISTGGTLESSWKNWSFNNVPYEAHLWGKMKNAGDEIVIQNAYILIKDN